MNLMYPRLFLFFCVGLVSLVTKAFSQDANGVYTKVDEAPVPIKTPPPTYPAQLKRDGVAGVVAIAVIIDEKGMVADATVTKSTRSEFEKPSVDAVKIWTFKPAKVAGSPVKVRVVVPLHFSLDS